MVRLSFGGGSFTGPDVREANYPQLLDDNFEQIFTVEPGGEITTVNPHDFVMTEEGNSLLMAYHVTTRDLSGYTDADDNPLPSSVDIADGVIQEVTADGSQRFLWNSWDHLQVEPDCCPS